jgi:hypothetical protein
MEIFSKNFLSESLFLGVLKVEEEREDRMLRHWQELPHSFYCSFPKLCPSDSDPKHTVAVCSVMSEPPFGQHPLLPQELLTVSMSGSQIP